MTSPRSCRWTLALVVEQGGRASSGGAEENNKAGITVASGEQSHLRQHQDAKTSPRRSKSQLASEFTTPRHHKPTISNSTDAASPTLSRSPSDGRITTAQPLLNCQAWLNGRVACNRTTAHHKMLMKASQEPRPANKIPGLSNEAASSLKGSKPASECTNKHWVLIGT
ncbi:hypothetical protein LTR24_003717 [Lithohypha guttulata]|uniref:Uncharacterized protein n=1 Tax=Lithohypha guttulata TaxID=1690604 RepID=A0ABR0KDU9_9EURO|nr:hypothetical protein LTR24_003717 [Lithohypha guttulata]